MIYICPYCLSERVFTFDTDKSVYQCFECERTLFELISVVRSEIPEDSEYFDGHWLERFEFKSVEIDGLDLTFDSKKEMYEFIQSFILKNKEIYHFDKRR